MSNSREPLIGLMADAGPDLVVGLLGILKSGAAFVPLSPAQPDERIAMIAADCGIEVLVTERRYLERALRLCTDGGSLRKVICLDEIGDPPDVPERVEVRGLAGFDPAVPPAAETPLPPERLAYVIYTSGSTGLPKGVGVSHGNLLPMLAWSREYFAFDETTRVLESLSYAFDFGVWEILTALTSGGTLCVPGPEEVNDPEAFARLALEWEIDTVNATPSFFQAVAQTGVELKALRRLHLGGEALTRDQAERLAEAVGERCHLYNGYGPTEATVNSLIFDAGTRGSLRGGPRVPIGRPSAHNTVYVLDPWGEPAPVGVAGELCVGGPGVARGYLGRPRLTAEKFVPDPFAAEPGSRLYRTGDLVRWLPAGDVEFLGRIDNQVKVRGFRIEPGEVEAALRLHGEVRDAVVLARESRTGGPTLVGYVVAGDAPPSAEELRIFLRQRLPEAMVPTAFVVLESLPLTSSGKVDRRALPAPQWEAAGTAGVQSPRTPAEELLAEIFTEVLGLPQVGIDESFFDLGGHSLLATRLMSRVRDVFGLELPLRRLFEMPTVEALAAEIETVLQSYWSDAPPLERAPEADRYPLSFAQERLWILDRLEPGNPAYNMPGAVRLHGELDAVALRRSLETLAARHESLRTTFAGLDGEAMQVIAPASPHALPWVDLHALPAIARAREAERLMAEEALRPFDLSQGPLLRTLLVREAEAEHVLLLNLHHIVSDGWSMDVLVRELALSYAAFREGAAPVLPELPVRYVDYAVWQRDWLSGAERESQLAYWREQLAGVPKALEIPTDHPRPAVRTHRAGHVSRRVPAPVAEALNALGRREGASLFMVLLAAFKVLLHRLAGEEDVVVGSPSAGRGRGELEGLIGMFLNTLVLRTSLAGDPSVRELLARVRDMALDAYAHQDVPFEMLLDDLKVERDLSRTPLFQVFFNMLNLPAGKTRLPGLILEPLPSPDLPSKFDLTLYVQPLPDGLRFDAAYNGDLFDAERIELLLEQLAGLLARFGEDPEARIGSLSLLTPGALAVLPDPRSPLGEEWHGAVHEKLTFHARREPGRLALRDRDGAWTYGELEARSNRLAHALVAAGLEPESPVAIYAHRSATLVWAVLGALKAGGAFTILDPAYPPARLKKILELASPRAFLRLTAAGDPPAELLAHLDSLPGCVRLDLAPASPEERELAGEAAEPPAVTVGPDHVAVLGFTSGSTGSPKGILGRHGPLSHFLPWQVERFGLRAEDRFSMLSGLSHDPLQRDLFTPLYLGAAICIPGPEEVAPARLASWMARERVTVAHLTPAMGQVLIEGAGQRLAVPSLRCVLLVGDVLTRLDVARLRKLAPAVTVVNLYGSTETQRAVAFHVVEEGGDERSPQVLPLGRGMRDAQLLVINRAGFLAGVGEVGEIWVRSPHLAQGYLGDPALTAEKFRTNPFTGEPGDRIYRTGDLGRYLPDGEVTFAGRADLQVKIRGFRIEPGEIEAALGALPGVREAVVVVREDRGEKRLVAYIVPELDGVSAAFLRRSLRERLPVYMVPSAFVFLERLPITPNGKVDRRALPAPPAAEIRDDQAFIAPESDLEEKIAAVWREVLGVEAVGVQDNFFDVGGHSLLLVRLHSRLQEALGREIPLMDLFSHPSIRSQAEHLGGGGKAVQLQATERRVAGGRFAIVGMAGRFPGAKDLERFWSNLRDGLDAVSCFSDEEMAAAGAGEELLRNPRFVRARGVLEGEAMFDADFFGFSPLQAALMDPQLRVVLECSWETLENAGYDPQRIPGEVGVYAGVSLSTYFLHNLATNPGLLQETGGYQIAIGTDRDYLASQISYKLGLTGPSVDVQTACSTSLVAVHMACQALLTGDCDMALAGGVSIKVPQVAGYLHQEGGIDSAQGRCRAFDAAADGTVWGSGVGLVALKRLEDAEADGDTIHAVILGSALNNDGSLKVGFTAPSVEAQAKVIASAHRRAAVPADTITYVEAHGTGTHLGDPIEVAALTRAFRAGTQRTGFCPVGSVKTNIGHLGAAAGIASLLKTVLALHHRQIPPSLHFETPNPAIDFASSPFYVNTRLAEWPAGGGPRRAGVSSFGLGGTNVHMVVEEAAAAAAAGPSRPWQLLALSARDEAALEGAAENLAVWLDADRSEEALADAAYTLQTGRRAFPVRGALVCRDAGEARRVLRERPPERMWTASCDDSRRPVVFLFPGQGAQHVEMGRGLYATEPAFRRELDACAERLRGLLGCDLRRMLFPAEAGEREEAEVLLRQTRFTQPALFAVEYALARLWLSWGVPPSAMIGHSLGEYVAACLAGVFSLDDALELVARRAELMRELPPGAMLSVELPEDEVLVLLSAEPGLSLAAVNGPDVCVVSGPEEAVAGLESRLAGRGAATRRLHTSYAFHSAATEAVLEPFRRTVRRVETRPPSVPYLSNLTGGWIEAGAVIDPESWVQHLRQTVRFGDGVARLLERFEGQRPVLLEVGPGSTLAALVRRQARETGALVLSSMRHPRSADEDGAVLLTALGRLWTAGVTVDWDGFYAGERRRRIPLPTYPFQRRRFWVEPGRGADLPLQAARLELGEEAGSRQEGVARPPAAPRNEIERWVAATMSSLLGVAEAGVHDDFFELGGHSLLGTRLLSKVRDELGVELPVATLFESSTVAALAAAIAARRSEAPPAAPPVVPVPRDGALPLSFAQERFWFLDRLEPGGFGYNMSNGVLLTGELSVPALTASLAEIRRRHEALRTVFPERNGEPVQLILPAGPAPLPVVDLSALPAARRAGELDRRLLVEARRPFDLAAGPLFRHLLLRLAEREHALTFSAHHIAADMWSTGLLVREISRLYPAALLGEASPLPELPVQYADFATWQRRWLTGDVLARLLAGWRTRLAGAPAALELPTDHPRPAAQTFRGASVPWTASPALTADLHALAQDEGVTLFMTLLAAWQTLLHRYSGQSEVVVGSPIAGRNREEVASLIGVFINTLALRGDLSGDPPVRELLGRTREVALEAYALQDLPFERLVEELQPARDLARTPLFQAMLVLQNAPFEALALPGLTLAPLPMPSGAAKFELTLWMGVDQEGRLNAALEHNTDLFEPGTAERMLRHFETLLAAAVADPSRGIDELPLLGEDERRQILSDWNDTRVDGLSSGFFHALFRGQAARTPEVVAVVAGEAEVTYQALAGRAHQLARHLRRLGVGLETRVGVCLERTADLPVALLAILEAGGCYVPLDPSYPRERLAWMLEDSAAPVVITQESLRETLPPHQAWIVSLDADAPAIELESAETPAVALDPAHLAYVLYTSGSTGRPKGVQLPHGALVNFLLSMRERPGLDAGDTLLAVTPVSFDIAGLELYLPLIAGARVVLASREDAQDGARLQGLIARSGATVMQATPATWRLLVESGWRGDGRLKVLCGGEALPDALAARLLERAGEVWNLYGPTETTIWSTVHRVRPGRRITLGRPVANTQVYVLEPTGEPAPPGVPGELLIGGDGLARGYLGRPDLTAERFVPDPFRGGGARLYRTGDLARLRSGGELEFLGRLDFQVKVRGYRIELGEIETVLGRHPSVAQAVVAARLLDEGDARLAAYAVLTPGAAPVDPQELRDHARTSLPEYMVPAAVVILEAFPLTPNGKVDRKALPAPERFESEREYVAPATPTEEALAAVWAAVLGLERVGTRDNFFALGGHSVLATRLMFRLRETLGVELPLRTLFEAPTIAQLAMAVAARRAGSVETVQDLPRIEPNPVDAHLPFPLTDVQEAYWIGRSGALELGSVSTHLYFELDLPELDLARLSHALRRLIDRHGMLRAVVLPDGRQRILPEVPPYEVTVLDLRRLGPEAAEAGALEVRDHMSHQVLPSDRWPLFEIAATLFADRVRLHVSLDLLIGDAWSFRLLGRELAGLYAAPDLELPPLDLSFRDYVVAEVALRESRAYQDALAYWRERLATLPPAPGLPLARLPGEIGTPRFARRQGRLPRAGWERLKERATRDALTPSGVLLAAWSEILAAWSETPDLTINLTLFNRLPLHPQVDDIVGDFTSLTLLAVERAPGLAFGERARRLQGRLWDDLDHRLVSGVRVLRELARQRGGRGAAMPVVFTSTLNQAEQARPETGETSPEDGRPVFSISQTPQVWLDHQVSERQGALSYVWDAVEQLFPAGMLDDMFAAYEGLIGRLADAEEAWREPVRDLLPAGQLRLLAEYNATIAPVPAGLLHEPFLAWAERTPDADAVITAAKRLTYGQLDRASLALAHRLRRLGVRPNQLVGIVMEKGWEQVVAAFAILRAGGAYLPIDARLPAERLHDLLERGEVAVALTQPAFAGSLDWPAGVARIAVDDSGFAGPILEPLPAAQGPEDLAYVIFTSGSTGLPKGVMIDHRGALNTCVDVNLIFGVGPADRVFALSQLSFDLSVYDIFGLLAAGGALVIPDAGTHRDPRHWAELAARERVTIWNSVPALMEMLVEYGAGRPGALDFPLRAVTLSGDWIPPRLPDRIRAAFPDIQIVSMGGATEASIWSIHYPIGEVPAEWVSIPYGRPMRNQTFFVLDGELEPRPVGVQGSLYIGGIGLAKGYWRDAEKTRAQFLTHPRTGDPLYRTGDLGRMLPDGNIEFLGRDDFQVKIQGHRIELGEIESALTQHPAVSAAVVTAHGDLRGAKQLVGYVVLKKPGEDMEEALRREDGRAWADLPAVGGAPAAHLARRRFHRAPVPLEDVGAVLASLLRVEIEGSPFPKHRYGSAGNLYPVQAYLYAAPGKVEGLAGGAYYYDPSGHGLVLLAEGSAVEASSFSPADREVFEESGFAIFLVARMAAIAPLYGALARRFVAIEAGLMAELLAGAAAEHGLGLSPAEGRLGELRGVLRLEESHEPMQALLGGYVDPDRKAPPAEPFPAGEEETAPTVTVLTDPIERLRFKTAHHGLRADGGRPRIELPKPRLTPERIEALYVARRSYRRFQEEAVPLADLGALLAALPCQEETAALDLLLYVKPGRVEGLPGGTYAYEPEAHRLALLREDATLIAALYDPVNRDVFERAGLALLFVARAGSPESGRDRRRAALEAGRRAQILETAAPAHRIGLVQMGGLRIDAVRDLFGLAPGDGLVHNLLGGRIAAEQIGMAAYLAEVAEYHALADGLGGPAKAPARPAADVLAELREFLRGKVPEYMVPAHLMRLDALPLSSNGKVDRKALPEPETLRQSDAPADGSYVAPETDVERVIADVVAQVLSLPRVGVHDNFFDLGANSVHVVRVHNALHATLGREISLMDMFNHPSVHRLAQHLGENGGGAAAPMPSQAEERSERLREGKDWRKQRLQKRRME